MWDEYLKKSCRTCLKVDEVELFDWKTERFDKKYNYAECFQEVTQLSLSQVMPQMLCYDCAYELRIAYAFLNRAKRVHLKLLSYRDKSQKYKLCNSTKEKSALFEMPTVAFDEIAPSSPARCGQVATNDLFGKIVAEALLSPFNDLEQESLANTTLIEQSIDLGSDETKFAVIQPAPPNLIHEEENQHQTADPLYGAEQSVGYIIDPNLCDDTLEGTNMETAVDSPSGVEFIKEYKANDEEEMTDGLLVPLEVLENKSKTAAASTKKRTLSRSYFCNECGAALANKYSLDRHQLAKHNIIASAKKKNYFCTTCGAGFTNKYNLYRHQFQKHNFISKSRKQYRRKGERKVAPQQCVKSKLALQKHMNPHESIDLGSGEAELAEENQHQTASTVCGAEQGVGCIIDPNLRGDILEDTKMETATDSPSDMKLSKAEMRNDEEVMADGLLVEREVLEENSRTAASSTKKKPLSQDCYCSACDFSFANKYNLQGHMKRHIITGLPKLKPRKGVGIQAKPQQCELCKETFPNKSKFTYHMQRTHGEWLCHACPRILKSKHALEGHVKTHDKNRERKFGCEVCGIKCLSAGILRGHMKVHEKDRKPKYACDECDKTFYVRNGLVLHKRFHTGDTVSCQECGRAFPRQVDLKIHMRRHSNERPYQCDICDQNFVTPYSLKNHKLEHEGVQHKCDQCDKVYTNRASFNYHRREHEDPSLQCQVCKKLFRRKDHLQRHITGVHKISTSEEAEEFVIRLKTDKKFHTRSTIFATEK